MFILRGLFTILDSGFQSFQVTTMNVELILIKKYDRNEQSRGIRENKICICDLWAFHLLGLTEYSRFLLCVVSGQLILG